MSSDSKALFAVRSLAGLTAPERRELMERSQAEIHELEVYVRPLIDQVRENGDAAVRALTHRFDGVDLGDLPLRVDPVEFAQAEASLPQALLEALDFAIANLRKGHLCQLGPATLSTQIGPGIIVGERITALDSVGLYVPRGKGSFPSVAMMLGIPAVIAGVPRPVIVTPPGPDGRVDAATLAVAARIGITEVYRVGGVQAVAALAFGTRTMPRVPKILGPGNAYVAAAKRVLYGVLDPGVPAGPSESIILTDGTVSAEITAADLLIEAEHGPDSCAVLVSTDNAHAERVAALLPALVEALPEQRRAFVKENFRFRSKILVAESMSEAIDFVNAFAPEHLEILMSEPEAAFERIVNAGEVMVGVYAPITLGNFCAGTNAILPTGGLARSASCLGVPDFQKRSSFLRVDREGFDALAPTAELLAEYEGFPAHVAAVRSRRS